MFKHSKGATNVQNANHCIDTSAAPTLLLSDAFFSSVKPPATPDAGEMHAACRQMLGLPPLLPGCHTQRQASAARRCLLLFHACRNPVLCSRHGSCEAPEGRSCW